VITDRRGTSLCEVLMALVLLAATASWALQAAAVAERAIGNAERHRQLLHRAEHALAELHGLPCDSLSVVRTVREPRWVLLSARDHDGLAYSDDVSIRATDGDSVRLHRGGWCD